MSRKSSYNVLLVGSGGREHATANLFLQSQAVARLYVAPGNDGMFCGNNRPDPRLEKIDWKANSDPDFSQLAARAQELQIDLTFVGPEQPLSSGIVDRFTQQGLAIVGPSKRATRLEGSKAEAKDILHSLAIPVPPYRHFEDSKKAIDYVKSLPYPVVVKADGLAAGKGSIVTHNHQEAIGAIRTIMEKKKFGEAGKRVVIEQRLDGEEFSFFAFTDGETVLPMAWARDYKPVSDNDQGLNTGGMGAYSPYRENEQELTQKVMQQIVQPLIQGCQEKYSFAYKGILYVGGTFIQEGEEWQPYVFEINVRMGDPEAQVIYPRLKTDIVEISLGIIRSNLASIKQLDWDPNYHLCVCVTSGRTHRKGKGFCPGYPQRYAIGKSIRGIENIPPEILIFHSGTSWDPKSNQFLTAGGRVLSIVASGPSLEEARQQAYQAVANISFEGMHYRTDIGSLPNID